ncbi:hypothetical protein NDU88_001229 [Pleurodeles waltl]|uniref:Uncharacterized protein n=1 Tax=Pleurodeles waltl TaxID=8319 RepID=A0AAV7R6J9_PLEWA|nr:hypothetical protein NDU88_001229 [Pleurodeles waltl]
MRGSPPLTPGEMRKYLSLRMRGRAPVLLGRLTGVKSTKNTCSYRALEKTRQMGAEFVGAQPRRSGKQEGLRERGSSGPRWPQAKGRGLPCRCGGRMLRETLMRTAVLLSGSLLRGLRC